MLQAPLGPISGNIKRNHELTLIARAKIIGGRDFGATPTQIANKYKHLISTVQYTLSKSTERNKEPLKPQSGRPKTYTEREERCILQQVQLHPKCTYADVRCACLAKLCDSTLKRILKKHSITN
jgi:hypothetical protein